MVNALSARQSRTSTRNVTNDSQPRNLAWDSPTRHISYSFDPEFSGGFVYVLGALVFPLLASQVAVAFDRQTHARLDLVPDQLFEIRRCYLVNWSSQSHREAVRRQS